MNRSDHGLRRLDAALRFFYGLRRLDAALVSLCDLSSLRLPAEWPTKKGCAKAVSSHRTPNPWTAAARRRFAFLLWTAAARRRFGIALRSFFGQRRPAEWPSKKGCAKAVSSHRTQKPWTAAARRRFAYRFRIALPFFFGQRRPAEWPSKKGCARAVSGHLDSHVVCMVNVAPNRTKSGKESPHSKRATVRQSTKTAAKCQSGVKPPHSKDHEQTPLLHPPQHVVRLAPPRPRLAAARLFRDRCQTPVTYPQVALPESVARVLPTKLLENFVRPADDRQPCVPRRIVFQCLEQLEVIS
jgi:hypothetical protein